ncbi:hypothetical protein [Nocardiopsis sp. CA-288880]|uniref:hypothetical protein n=1 Tax=Nocardiopsis sp. CA-288880 TaxID=3239995 RepID=UPI003D9910BD
MDLFQTCTPRERRKFHSVRITHDNIHALTDQVFHGAVKDGALVFSTGRQEFATGRVGDWLVRLGTLMADTLVLSDSEYHQQYVAFPELPEEVDP